MLARQGLRHIFRSNMHRFQHGVQNIQLLLRAGNQSHLLDLSASP